MCFTGFSSFCFFFLLAKIESESTTSASEIPLFTTTDRGYDIISAINVLDTVIYQIGRLA